MTSVKYIGMDVHTESTSIAVRNSLGKIVMECVIETKASTLLQFLDGLRGDLRVVFEEVSDRGSRTLDRCASARTAPHALPASGLHTPPPPGSAGAAQQKSPLRSLACSCVDLVSLCRLTSAAELVCSRRCS
jgi:hypothetical protein